MANLARQSMERRSESRVPTHHDLTPFLKRTESAEAVRSILIDISTIGIGIRSFDYLKPDAEVLVRCGADEVRFRVAWSRADLTQEGLWHIGLLALNANMDLKHWFEIHGMHLDATQTKVIEQGATVTFSSIRSLIAAAHTSDISFFSRAGMEQHMQDKRAYPINYNGASLVVLLPKGMKPKHVEALSDIEAKSKITVFKRTALSSGQSRWLVAWPT